MNENLSLIELLSATRTDLANVFSAPTHTYGLLGIYGGHFLGQALSAAFATVERPKLAHSFHAYFLQRGDLDAELTYHVTSLRSRPNGDTRAVTARQNGIDRFHMVASFKTPETGSEHQPLPPQVPSAIELINERRARGEGPIPFPFLAGRAELELFGEPFFAHSPDRAPTLQGWTRAIATEHKLDDRQRQVVLAFLSDSTLMFNSVLPHGAPFQTHRLTSLDHAAWYHHDADPTAWMLYDQRSTTAFDGRGMNHGHLFAADGRIAMTCAQESMLRTELPT
jgi:acyl-CoA thioesterase II